MMHGSMGIAAYGMVYHLKASDKDAVADLMPQPEACPSQVFLMLVSEDGC